MMEHGVCCSMSSGLNRKSVLPFLTRGFFDEPLPSEFKRYKERDDWYPIAALALRFLGDAKVLCDRQVDACSTEPSEARSASSKFDSSAVGYSDANRASLKSVDSSSCSGVEVRRRFVDSGDASSCGASTRFLFRDTKASISDGEEGSFAHICDDQAEAAELSWETRRSITMSRV